MRTYHVSHTTARSVIKHSATILFCALAMLGLLSCGEPVGVSVDDDVALLERFVESTHPSTELLASVKPLLARERGQSILRSIRNRDKRGVAQLTHTGEPDYTVTSIPFDQDPTPPGTHPFLRDDDFTTGLIPIGFEFEFFGTRYTQINIATNGFVGFDAGMGQGCCEGYPIPAPDLVNNVIAALWSDLVPDESGQIFFGVTGEAPNRRFIVHYRNVAFWPSDEANRLDVQIKLFETTNVIEIHSLTVPPDGHVHTQGIENASGTDAYFVSGRVARNFELTNDAVRFTPPADDTPPLVTARVTGAIGSNGWYTSNVDIDWTVADAESPITGSEGCVDLSVTADQQAVTYTCTATSSGGSASASVTVKRDATSPVVAYSGNAGAYTVDQLIEIVCGAGDATSGVASTTCVDVAGDAYTFALGTHTLSASASDRAGNVGGSSTTFTVTVTAESLCNLVRRWVDQKGLENSLCQQLANGSYDAFRNRVSAQSGKQIPAGKAELLIRLSRSL